MISMSKVTPENASSEYYDKEGYYTPGSDAAREASSWFGKGAKDAGLVGEVDGKRFTQLLEGIAPDGQLMGRKVGGDRVHRPGLDVTFNAPKSFSVAALVMGDDRLIKAHDAAVKEVMSYIEQNLVATRIGKNGAVEEVQAPHIIAGLFRHETSRKLDPQMHTHAVIANMVKTDLGDKYRALHNDPISNNVRALTQLYHNHLYEKTKGFGYDIEFTRQGFVEIKGLEELSDLYSKRSKQMAEALKERGLEPTGASKQMAALITRDPKRNADRRDLDPIWAKEAETLGWTKDRMEAFVDQARSKAQSTERDPSPTQGAAGADTAVAAAHRDAEAARVSATKTANVKEAVDFAIRHISEREALYSVSELKAVALQRLQTPDLKAVDVEVNRLVAAKRLYTVETPKGRHASDNVTLAAERDIIRQLRVAVREPGVEIEKSTRFTLSLDRTAETAIGRRLDRTILTEGQKDAIKTALLGQGRFVGIQGYAGTGKTTMMDVLNKYAERYGYTVQGIAPTRPATGELGKFLDDTNTVRSHILDIQNMRNLPGDPSKTILIVDEASMVSSQDMQLLMRHANDVGYARVVLVGDIKQLESPSAGIPFQSLQRAGMATALMDDIRRQTNETAKEAVIHAMRGEVGAAFEKIAHLKTTDNIRQTVAEDYLSRSRDARQDTGVLVMTNAARVEINEHIRAGLRAEGTLRGDEVTTEVINPLHFTRAQSGDAGSYRSGDTLISVFKMTSYDIEAQDVLTVMGRDIDQNRIEVKNEYTGQLVTIQLGQHTKASEALVAFSEGKRAFAAGDLVRFAIHDPEMNVEKGASGTITKIDAKEAHVQLHSGEQRVVPLDTVGGRGMDHAYALTAHAFQGKTIKDIIVGVASTERMATQKALYVGISRAKNAATLITDNTSKLIGRLSRNSGESLDALEAVTKARIERLGGSYVRDQANKISKDVDVGATLDTLKERHARDDRDRHHEASREGDASRAASQEGRPENGAEALQGGPTSGLDHTPAQTRGERSEAVQNTPGTSHPSSQLNGSDGHDKRAVEDPKQSPEQGDKSQPQEAENDLSKDALNGAAKDAQTDRENGADHRTEEASKNGQERAQNRDEKDTPKRDLDEALKALEEKANEIIEERSRGRDERTR